MNAAPGDKQFGAAPRAEGPCSDCLVSARPSGNRHGVW